MLNQSISFLGTCSGCGGFLGDTVHLLGEAGCGATPSTTQPTCECPSGTAMAEMTVDGVKKYWCQSTKPTSKGWTWDWSKILGEGESLVSTACKLFGFGCPRPAPAAMATPGYDQTAWYETTGGMIALGLGAVGVGALVYVAVKK